MKTRPASGPLAAGVLLVAGCTASPPPRAPAPVWAMPPPPPLPAPPPADWRDWPVTPGTWSYRRDDRGSLALFGTPGADALLTLRCDRAARMVYLARAGAATAPLTLRTTSLARSVTVQPTGGTPPYVAATLAPSDPLLDALGFSRGRFVVGQEGGPPLVVPAWPEIERATEDCRS